MHVLRAVTWRWLTAAVLGSGLLAGGVWYGYTSQQTRGARAQEAPAATPTPAPPAAAPTDSTPTASTPAGSPAPGQAPAQAHPQVKRPQAKPQNANARRPTGEVIAISPEQASLTMRTADGEDLTFRVLQTTVFAAGRVRPYRFELLKVGDQVTVVGGMGQDNGAGAAAKPAGTGARGQGPRAAARNAQANGELVARQVLVRPAGDMARPGAGTGKKAGGQKQAGQQQTNQEASGQAANGRPQNGQNDGGTDGTGQ